VPAPLSHEKREAIEHAIREGGTCSGIAREHQVSRSTVSKIGKEIEAETGSPSFERSQTKSARAALDVDVSLQRVELAKLLMVDAFRIRERMWEEQVDYVSGGSEFGAQRVERPTNAREFKDFATAIGIMIDKVGVLTREDSEGLAAVDAWLKSITGI